MSWMRSVLRWLEDRTGVGQAIGKLARHPVPPRTGWMYVFGSATLVVFIVQIVTGVALAALYVPSAGHAYDSLRYIQDRATLGWLVRGMHYVGASLMVILVGIHAIRVFLTGSFKFPREMGWISGALLLLLTLGMGFTGQLLRWDQNGLWSVVVGAEQAGRTPLIGKTVAHAILGGQVVGDETLSRFFSLHVFMIPAMIFAILGLHLFLVFRNGISEPPVAGQPVERKTYRQRYRDLLEHRGRPFWPDAAWRDVLFAVLVIAVLVILAWSIGAPSVNRPPDPTNINADPRPDWYLLWYFALLALLPPGSEAYVIIGGPLLFVLVLICLPLVFGTGERHPRRRPWAVGAVLVVVTMIGALSVEGYLSPWSPDFSAKPLPVAVVGTDSGPVARGAELFHDKGCEYCHRIDGYGGRRGPDLSRVADRLTRDQMIIRIMNGATNMPAFADILTPGELSRILTFLGTRTAAKPTGSAAPASPSP